MQIRPFIRRFFPAPAWDGTDEEGRIAGITNDLLGLSVLVIAVHVTVIFATGFSRTLLPLAATAVTGVVFEGLRRLLRPGWTFRLATIAALLMIVPGTVLTWLTGGIGVVQGGTLLVGIAFCAVTVGFRVTALMGAVSLAAYAVVTWMVHELQVPPRMVLHPFNEWMNLLSMGSLLLAGTTLVRQDLVEVLQRSLAGEQAARAEREARLSEAQELASQLEARVRERTRELQQTARDMGVIVQSVSHDLRSPVLAISGYADVLLRREGAALPPSSRELLGRIGRNARWLASMLDRLLDYTRAQSLGWHPGTVPLDGLVADVVADLQVAWPRVQFEVEPLGLARGDEVMLRQVFENLLGNACKFAARVPQPLVRVRRWRSEADGWVYEVCDNGPGFQPDQAERIFDLFHRAHTPQEFEGSGVGLAIVRRLVEQHGGRAWADAVPGQGATLSFTLGPPPA